MPIEFSCSQCSSILRVPDEHAGKQAKCPSCGAINTIPSGSSTSGSSPVVDPGSGATWGSNPNVAQPVAQPAPPYGAAGAPDYSKPMAGASPYASPGAAGMGAYREAHRGGLILTLGIFAIVCNVMAVPGILAWVLGASDLKKIQAGVMDPSGEGLTRAGMIMGIIGTCLAIAGLLFYCLFFGLAMAGGGMNM